MGNEVMSFFAICVSIFESERLKFFVSGTFLSFCACTDQNNHDLSSLIYAWNKFYNLIDFLFFKIQKIFNIIEHGNSDLEIKDELPKYSNENFE